MDVISTEGLTKYYGRRVGIDGLTLSVARGSILGFLGPNGSGKTTTIRLLLGFLRPDRGRALIGQQDCWRDHHNIKRQLGYVPGDLRLPAWMTGQLALSILSKARGADLRHRGEELADYFSLELDVRVRNMSRGMRQKLGLIMALVHEPQILVLDEPTSGLDPINQDRLYRMLLDLAKRECTIFFSSHVLSEVEGLCDRVAILREGHMVTHQTLTALRTQAKRKVSFRWQDGTSTRELKPPAVLKLSRQDSAAWEGVLDGPVTDLLSWLGQQAVDDVFIGKPDLDELFHHYYENGPDVQ